MDALTDIALLNMPGPSFLAFYAVVALITLALVTLLIMLGERDTRPLPRVPQRPAPYEIAYLRGGEGAVTGVAIYALKRAGFIELGETGRVSKIPARGAPPDRIEERVLDEIAPSAEPRDILRSSQLRRDVETLCEPYRLRLDRQGLLTDSAIRWRAGFIATIAAIGLAGLAALKIAVAEAHGHNNVGFLLIEVVGALGLLFYLVRWAAWSKANARGKAYLKQMKTAYSDSTPIARDSSFDVEPSANAVALAMVGLFGFAILRGGPDAAFAKQMRDSGDGGGADGGGGDGGGGCGGCGSS